MIKSNSLSIKTYLCKVKVPLKYDRRCQIKVIVHGKDSWANAQLMFTPQSLAFLSQVINSCALGLGELAGDCIWRQDGGSVRPQCHSAPAVIRSPMGPALAVEAKG